MAKAVLICGRHAGAVADAEELWRVIARRLTPDNVEVRQPLVGRVERAVSVVLDPNGATEMAGASVCLGVTEPRAADWMRPEAAVPDGSFALWRVDSERVEIVADALASRTIWYVQTDEIFVASTSQRAIVMLLGDFRSRSDAVAWMLSSGTLGPGASWDARLRAVPPGGRVVLDRAAWRLRQTHASFEFAAAPTAREPAASRAELAAAVQDAVARLKLDPSRWVLTLSGGVDCRGVLLALLEGQCAAREIRCITWGRRETLTERGNDGYVARLLAERTGVSHHFLSTDLAAGPPVEQLLERFLVAGEGRVAHISGYLDGFALWRALRNEGIDGIIRGDHVFGRSAVRSEAEARRVVSMTVLEDHFDPRERAELELARQRIPAHLERAPGETLATWRDRICQQFAVPTLLAGLTDLKCSYVEVANPLLAARIVRHVRTLSDAERTGKRLWREAVTEALPGVPFAKRIAIVPLSAFLATVAMRELMADELGSAHASGTVGPGIVRRCRAALARRPAREAALLRLPAPGERLLRAARRRLGLERPALDPLVLAFRACVAARMARLLEDDAAALANAARSGAGVSRTAAGGLMG